jgi:hypothetical protein
VRGGDPVYGSPSEPQQGSRHIRWNRRQLGRTT